MSSPWRHSRLAPVSAPPEDAEAARALGLHGTLSLVGPRNVEPSVERVGRGRGGECESHVGQGAHRLHGHEEVARTRAIGVQILSRRTTPLARFSGGGGVLASCTSMCRGFGGGDGSALRPRPGLSCGGALVRSGGRGRRCLLLIRRTGQTGAAGRPRVDLLTWSVTAESARSASLSSSATSSGPFYCADLPSSMSSCVSVFATVRPSSASSIWLPSAVALPSWPPERFSAQGLEIVELSSATGWPCHTWRPVVPPLRLPMSESRFRCRMSRVAGRARHALRFQSPNRCRAASFSGEALASPPVPDRAARPLRHL